MSHSQVRRSVPVGRLVTVSRVLLVAVVVAFAAGRVVGLDLSLRTQAWIYLAGMVGLNLPHGGYEQFVNLRRRRSGLRRRYLAGYLALVALYLGLFVVAPVPALALALAVACLKGGASGLATLRATGGVEHLPTRPRRLLAAVVRGGAVMVVPLVAYPGPFAGLASTMVGMFRPAAFLPSEATLTALAGGYALALVAHVGLGAAVAVRHRGRRGGSTGDATPGGRPGGVDGTADGTVTGDPVVRSWLVDAGETLLLVAYFAVVPPVVAVGLYFPLWYTVRGLAREAVAAEAGGRPGPDGSLAGDPERPTDAASEWHPLRTAAAGTATFGVVAAALWVAAPYPLAGGPLPVGLLAFWTVLVSVVALPHVVVGGVLDRRAGIWHVP